MTRLAGVKGETVAGFVVERVGQDPVDFIVGCGRTPGVVLADAGHHFGEAGAGQVLGLGSEFELLGEALTGDKSATPEFAA